MCSLQWKARVPSPCSDRPSLHAQTMATLPCRCLPRLTSPAAYTSLQLPPQTLPIVTALSIASLPHSMAELLNKSRALAFLLSGLGFWFPSIFLLAESRPDLGDSEAMSDLRRSLQAPPSLGWRGPDSCKWENVVCSEGRVTAIQIGDRNLEGGPLPASLNKLAMLERLELQGNGVSGPLPSLQGLSSLSVLILSGNRFSSIPGDFFDGLAALQSVAVDGNPFSAWEIPASLGNASALQNFSASSANVVGTISPSFAELKSLRSLNLADNRLTGSIPEELAALPELAQLDVSRNRLHGRVPAFRSESIVRIDGNPDMAMEERVSGPPSGEAANTSSNESPAPIGLIVLSATGGLFLFSSLCVLLGFCLYRGKQKQKQFIRVQSQKADPDGSSKIPAAVESPVGKIGAMAIPIRVLRSVTDDFSEANVLGRGGFGTVYRGELQDGTKVAVKRMDPGAAPGKGSSEFQSEIAVLTRVRHRNLVSLLGYCLEGGERLLVYEYMPQGTLSRHVFGWAAESGLGRPMEWARRLAVALDVARGVEYLHALAHQSFIHRDLKPSNILLGDDLRAKVADFGLVRLAPDGKCSIQTTIAGTFGYLAPEYAATGRVSTKVDVYSFGVILMELVTGRKSLDDRRSEDSLHLVPWFRRLLSHQDSFRPAVDPAVDLADEDTFASVSAVAELSGHCCRRDPSQRPEMSHVVGVLSSLVEQWKPGADRNPDGVDSELSLPRVLEMWRASEEESGDLGCSSSSSYFVPGSDGARPARPSDFTALDGR